MRLRRFLLLVFATLALVPFAASCVLFHLSTKWEKEQMAKVSLDAMGHAQAEHLSAFLDTARQSVMLLANEPSTQQALSHYGDPEMQEDLATSVRRWSKEGAGNLGVCVTAAYGVILQGGTAQAEATVRACDGSIFQQVPINGSVLAVSFEDAGQPTAYLAVCPVLVNGIGRGYVMMQLDLSSLTQVVQSSRMFDTGNIFVIDPLSQIAASAVPVETKSLGAFTKGTTFSRDLKEKTLFSYTEKGKHKYYGYYQRLTESNAGWAVLCTVDSGEFGWLSGLRWLVMIVLLVIFVGMLAVCYRMLTSGISVPLRKLESAIHSIDEGDYSTRVPFLGASEFGEVSKAFNRMLRRIEKDRRELSLRDERNRILNEQSNSIILEYNMETAEVIASPNARMLAHYPECFAQVPSSFVEKVVCDEESRQSFCTLFDAMCRGQKSGAMEMRLQNYKGRAVWFSVLLTTISDPQTCKPLRVVGRFSDIDEERRKTELLAYQAERDPLTQLYNKAATHSAISEALTKREDDEIDALFIIDVDDFKRVNDNYGHQKGDDILVNMAQAIRGCFREGDVVGRIGGDEFMVLMVGAQNLSVITQRANQLLEAMYGVTLNAATGEHMTGSVGIALCPQDGVQYTQLYSHADNALYTTKRSGKNNYSLYRDI